MTRLLGSDPTNRTAAPAGMREQVMRAGLRRRRFAFAGAGSAVAVAVVAAAGLLAGGTAGTDSLRIDQPAGGGIVPRATTRTGATGSQIGGTTDTTSAARPQPFAPTGPGQAPASAAPGGQSSAAPATGHGTHGPMTRTGHENKGVCTGDSTMVGTGGFNTSSWCLYVAPPDAHGAVILTVCRSAKPTDGSPLTFATTKEADFAVSAQGRTVWTWSKGQTFRRAEHELVVGYNACVDWTTRWDGRDERGRPVGSGQQLTLTAWSTADELSGRRVSVRFTG